MTDESKGACGCVDEDLVRAEATLAEAATELKVVEAGVAHALQDVEVAERDVAEALSHRLVEVTVDRLTKTVKAGRYKVAEFKREVGVAADRELNQVMPDGILKPLPDDSHIEIVGCEVFVSSVRCGGSA